MGYLAAMPQSSETVPAALPLAACPHCDLLYRRPRLQPGERCLCPRCGGRLHGRSRLGRQGLAALAAAALICYAIANACPIVSLHIHGLTSSATLAGSVGLLWRDGQWPMATLVAATTLAFPLLDALSILALLASAPRRDRPPPPWFARLFHLHQAQRPWGMVEVFLLGVLVSLVKLLHMAHLVPGVALWAFACLAVQLTAMQSIDLRDLWEPDQT